MILKSIKYQSAQIFYRTTGKGLPVLLLHGFGEDGEIWNEQVEKLKKHFRVIVPDLPGSGISEPIRDMSIEGMAEIVKALSDVELNEGTNGTENWQGIFGHSMGGYITLALAEKYPGLLSSFGLIHSTAFADSDEKKANRLKSINFIRNNGAWKFLKTSIPGLFHRSGHNLSGHSSESDKNNALTKWPDRLIEKGKNFTDKTLISYYLAMFNRPDRTAVVKNFDGPVLFIFGVNDIAVSFLESLQQSYLASESHIHILRNSAHMGMLEEPDKVSEILIDFLNKNSFHPVSS